MDIIKDICAFRFTWDAEHGGRVDICFIAEEVMKFFPEVTGADADAPGYATVMDYSRMTVVLLAAMKEQQAIIDAMALQLNEMQEALSSLQHQMPGISSTSGGQ
jgi:hypothetical protein